MVDVVKLALEHMVKLRRALEACREQDGERSEGLSGEAIRGRARSLPSLVASAGLVPALTFYMSKAGKENVYKEVIDYIEGRAAGLDREACREFGKGEGLGYASLLALSASMLHAAGYLDRIESFAELAASLLSLRGSVKEVAAARLLLDYLVEVKKLAEAFFGKKEGS